MNINYTKYSRLSFLFLFVLLALFTACDESNNEGGTASFQYTVTWKSTPNVTADKGVATLLLEGKAGSTWKAEVVEGTDWCAFVYNFSGEDAHTTGILKEGVNALYVYYRANKETNQRVAKIRLTFTGSEAQEYTLTQLALGEVVKNPIGHWIETPTIVEQANYEYVTHYTKLSNGKKVRNYSLCFDKSKKAALWVAYPLHDAYLGNILRTDLWDYDPVISDIVQPCIYKGFRSTGGDRYDRGHQLPSADRLNTLEMNEQTFFFTNMTPQMSRLNQDMWAKLEGKVRDNRCSDTLYVVTGTHFANTSKKALDNNDIEIPVPTHYYKVFLRTKSGKTGKNVKDCSASELKAIGVWVEHKNYGNVYPPKEVFMSVSAIEQKTGLCFFPEIPEEVKKDYNLSDWRF